jgi:multidrug resistance efflux pump
VAAMQRAEEASRSAQADAQASNAQAKAALTRAAWHTVRAPYSGRVTDLWVSAGDLATPGKPPLGLYDPAVLRVIAQVPESLAGRLQSGNARRTYGGYIRADRDCSVARDSGDRSADTER